MLLRCLENNPHMNLNLCAQSEDNTQPWHPACTIGHPKTLLRTRPYLTFKNQLGKWDQVIYRRNDEASDLD